MERRSSLSSYGVTLTDVHNMSPGLGRKPPLQRKQAVGKFTNGNPVYNIRLQPTYDCCGNGEGILVYDILDVAKYVLYYARKHGCGMSVLQLMKILYFVQAQFLVSKKKRVFSDDIVALDWGPMERKVWAKYNV